MSSRPRRSSLGGHRVNPELNWRPPSPLLSERIKVPIQLLPSPYTAKPQSDSPQASQTETKLMTMMQQAIQRLDRLENHVMKLTRSQSDSPLSLADVHSAVNELPKRITVQLDQALPKADDSWRESVEERLDGLNRTCDDIYKGVHCNDKPVASFLPQQLRKLQETCNSMSAAIGPMEVDGVTTGIQQILEILVKNLLPAMNQFQSAENPRWQSLVGHVQQLTTKMKEIDGSVSRMGHTLDHLRSRERELEAKLQQTKDQLALAHRSAADHRNFKSMAERLQCDLHEKEQRLRRSQEENTQLKGQFNADVSSLQAQLDKRMEEMSSLQAQLDKRMEEISSLKENERMQKELQEKTRQRSRTEEGARPNSPHTQRRASATEEMWIQQGEGHDDLIQDVEDLLTDTEGPLGLLEKHLKFYDAHVLLSSTFQLAYDESRDVAIDHGRRKLQSLFSKQQQRHSSDMDYTSRAYGMLLHAVGARCKEVNPELVHYIANKVSEELARTNTLFNSLLSKLQQPERTQLGDALTKIVSLAWRLVAHPSPVIVCQPQVQFDREIMDKELLHWDKTLTEYELVYAHPVVYRSYSGMVESKGAVGNRTKSTPVDEVKRKDDRI